MRNKQINGNWLTRLRPSNSFAKVLEFCSLTHYCFLNTYKRYSLSSQKIDFVALRWKLKILEKSPFPTRNNNMNIKTKEIG